MPDLKQMKARRKLEELDVLGALDNLIDLADPDSGGPKRSRLERARLRTIQTITISIIIALSIIIVIAVVMGALRENWTNKPVAPPVHQQAVAPSVAHIAHTTPSEGTVNLIVPPELTESAAAALALKMCKWECTTLANNIAGLNPARHGGVIILTEEGQHYNRISHISATGESKEQYGFETSIDTLHEFLGFDGNGCSYYRDFSKLVKFDMAGKQVWSIERPINPGGLLPLPDGGLLALGSTPSSTPGSINNPQRGSISCTVARLDQSGQERWSYTVKQYLRGMQAGPDDCVYFYSCPWVKDEKYDRYGPQYEQSHLCCLTSDGRLQWRMESAVIQPKHNQPQLAFTPGGDVLLALPHEADGRGELLLIDGASGKQRRSIPAPGICHVAAAPDGTVYMVLKSSNGRLCALDAKLELKWQQELNYSEVSPPLVFPDSSVSVLSRYQLRGLSSSGKQLYLVPLPEPESYSSAPAADPVALSNGLVLVPSGGKLLAFQHRDWSGAKQ